MPIIRAKQQVVAISRAMIEDSRLSWEARGIMAFLESDPEFAIDAGHLAGIARDAYGGSLAKAHQVAWRALSELIAAGYLRDDQV